MKRPVRDCQEFLPNERVIFEGLNTTEHYLITNYGRCASRNNATGAIQHLRLNYWLPANCFMNVRTDDKLSAVLDHLILINVLGPS